jgi:hypothetical protein
MRHFRELSAFNVSKGEDPSFHIRWLDPPEHQGIAGGNEHAASIQASTSSGSSRQSNLSSLSHALLMIGPGRMLSDATRTSIRFPI